MKTFFRGLGPEVESELKSEALEFGVSIGRRAPLHRIHADCIREIAEAGLKPVIFIGSINGADSPFFDPVKNPLTLQQQKDQLKAALPDYYNDAFILTLPDVGNQDKWFDAFFQMFDGTPFKGKSVVHYRTKASDAKAAEGAAIRPLSEYMEGFGKRGLPAWESHNSDPADDHVNATDIRGFDLLNLTPEQRGLMSAPDYIIEAAKKARAENPDRALLEAAGVPLTVFDLTLDRLRREADISTAAVLQNAPSASLADLGATTTALLKQRHLLKEKAMTAPFEMKIASASCNQTGGDWPRNVGNICRAIDKAVEDGADILALEELGLTGYERGDDFYYSDNAKTRGMLQLIADYAAAKDPNLVISIGHPWYFADKDIPDQNERRKNPIYNRVNNQFNVQTLLSGGDIIAMSAKRYLFNYERGYEKRHFEEWSDSLADQYKNDFGHGRDGTIMIRLPGVSLPDGVEVPEKLIPFGSPVVQIGSGSRAANLTHIICEEYWIGSRYDGSVDNRDFDRDNPLAQKAQRFDITVALNPNASPPVANKIDKHHELCKLGSRHCEVFVHTDGLGSSGSTFAQFGSRLMAQKGEIISEGVRASFADFAYTSQTVTVMPPRDRGHAPHVTVPHSFAAAHSTPQQDGPALWEKSDRREMEEEMRNELLWLFDYMRKNKIQGVTQALSGGADSAYNAAKVRLMVDLGVAELGVEGFMEQMSHLKYKDAVLEAFKTGGKDAAVGTLMDNMLTCVYMGTDNSSEETLRAAKTLVEGGVDADGKPFKGIGGKFHYRNVQRLVEVYAEIFSGVNPGEISDARDTEIRKELADVLRLRKDDVSAEELDRRVHVLKSTFEEVAHDVLSTANDNHTLAYENIQARLRQVLIMLFSNVENKIAIANPNLDEGRNSYATWGGDLHGGMISGNAHKNKQRQLDHMKMLFDHGLEGVPPIRGFYWALKNRPSAELQPKSKDGKVTQFDEDQLGRSFTQMDVISHFMLYDRPVEQHERKNSPVEVFEKCRQHPAFAGDSLEVLHDRIRLSYEKWAHAQFKVHGSPIAATYGKNIDHQSSLRTPNIGAFHRPELAEMAIHTLDLMAQRDGSNVETLTNGQGARSLAARALMDDEFAAALTAKMWTPGATDGRKMKIGTLYGYIKANGFGSFAKDTKMSKIFKTAASFRQNAANANGRRKTATPGI